MTAGTGDWQKALEMLQPLKAQIDNALAIGDVDAAMHLAFNGAAEAASLVSEAPVPGGARVHGVYVELAPKSLTVYDDGTLGEDGTYVNLAYQCEDIELGQAELLAGSWDPVILSASHWTVDSS
jgi:hypothetical protein